MVVGTWWCVCGMVSQFVVVGFAGVDTVFCPVLINASKQIPKSKKLEKSANHEIQSQKKVLNKCNTVEW